MKIIIVGAGRIGTNLARSLSDQDNEVYLIESDQAVATKISEKLDAKVISGNGASPDVLEKAQPQRADLILAVTTSDETNLVVCTLASMYGTQRRIARVRNLHLSRILTETGQQLFNVQEIINPELVAARAITKIVETPGASEVADFADGRILLRAFDIPPTSPILGMRIEDLRDEDFPWPFLITSIIRDQSVLIPKGDTCLRQNDRIYVLLPSSSIGEFVSFVNPEIKIPKKVIVYGSTITGAHVAQAVAERVRDVILIEEDEAAAKDAADRLNRVRVINGSASEADILKECGAEVADAFIATSDNDHSNLISSVLAKKMGTQTTIITTQHADYMSIIHSLNIDVIINPHYLAVEQILRLIRGKGISSVAKLLECDAEALEIVPEDGAPVTKSPIKDIRFPKNVIVGAVYSGDEVILANGDTHIRAGEKVIVFCQENAVRRIQHLFTRHSIL